MVKGRRDLVALEEDKEFAGNGKQQDSAREKIVVVSDTTGMSVPQKQESIWEDQSTAVQKLLERYLHQIALWVLASSRMSILRVWIGLKIRRTGRLKNNQTKPKKSDDNSAVAIVKDVRQLGCVSQNAEPPESPVISRKGTQVLGPIRRVRFTRAALRQANIRENKGPSLNKIQIKLPHQRSPDAVKFEDRFQEETERQERCARGDPWRHAKNIYKLKEKGQSYILFVCRWVDFAGRTHNKTERKRVRGRFRSKHAYGQQERP